MKTIVLFCHRFFELRFMLVSRLIDQLAERFNLVIMLPEDLIEGLGPHLPKSVRLVSARFPSNRDGLTRRLRLLAQIDSILYFTFAHTNSLPNATAEFHRIHHLKWAEGMPRTARLGARLHIWLSRICSRWTLPRAVLQKAYYALSPKRLHREQLDRIRPDLMVGCSFGMGLSDGAFLAEAKARGVPSAVIVQSWDRTSNKGFPTVHPDYAIVWNEIMRRECEVHLEFPPERVFVEGAPIWDRHFSGEGLMSSQLWRRKLRLPRGRKVIFYACGGFGSHPANMEVIPQIFELAEKQLLPEPVHILFRLYPQYYAPASETADGLAKRHEIEDLIAGYESSGNVTVMRPKVIFDGKNFLPSEEDQTLMLSCLKHCDVSLSQVSSQMIEACIFDKPAINIEYGRRRTEKYDIDIGDYLTEHLLRVYRTGAIYRVRNLDELSNCLAHTLKDPGERSSKRRHLVEQEAPVHRGNSAAAVVDRLLELCEPSNNRGC